MAAPLSPYFSPFPFDCNPDAKSKSEIQSTGGCSRKRANRLYLPRWNSLENSGKKPVFYEDFWFTKRIVLVLNRKRNMYVSFELGQVKVYRVLEVFSRTTSKDFYTGTENLSNWPMEGSVLNIYIPRQTSPYYRAPHIYVAIRRKV